MCTAAAEVGNGSSFRIKERPDLVSHSTKPQLLTLASRDIAALPLSSYKPPCVGLGVVDRAAAATAGAPIYLPYNTIPYNTIPYNTIPCKPASALKVPPS